MTAALFERGIAFLGALLVGSTAIVQLKNDWSAHGLDAVVTKLLLGLMAFGCVLVLLATIHVLGGS
ncbi:MAG TPA: hypothetical protein VME66_04940 [Candidatus Acidoferrales bacterium]|nr:hypothetical protein [Candidatus Acidoferrales bacterium]